MTAERAPAEAAQAQAAPTGTEPRARHAAQRLARTVLPRAGLRRRLLIGLFGYVVLLSIAVTIHGYLVNEHAERLVWQTLLESEMEHFVEQTRADPPQHFLEHAHPKPQRLTSGMQTLEMFDGNDIARLPPTLRGLTPGLYDEILVNGRDRVALVRDVDGRRWILALDITDFERRELDMTLTVAGSAIVMVTLLGLVIAWSVGRLVRPLSDMASRIATLRPDRADQRIAIPSSASAELVVIADALNDYLQRHERFIERERVFIDSASHELRTPIAVIAGSTELALSQPDVPAAARNHLERIRRTAREVEQLISLLLVLAKDPARLAGISDRVALDQLLPEIVEDHRHLTRDKDLALRLTETTPCEVVAPLPIVQAAIGNLLRNAIENSDRGEIAIRLHAPATVVIEDPGHGMTPEEISAIYARLARGEGRDGGGIGLDLISRLCEHLGWTLRFDKAERGTRTTLVLTSGG